MPRMLWFTRRWVPWLLLSVISGSTFACAAPATDATPSPATSIPASVSPTQATASPFATAGGSAAPTETPADPSPVGTGPTAVTLPELASDAATFDGRLIIVSGSYVGTPEGQVLSELLLESYPPQAGGATVALGGQLPPEIERLLDSTVGEPGAPPVTWGFVEIIGTFHAGGAGALPGILEMEQVRILDL